MMQVMTAAESASRRARIRVQIDRRTQDRDVALAEGLEPASAARRDERLEARRQAREGVRQRVAQLAATRH